MSSRFPSKLIPTKRRPLHEENDIAPSPNWPRHINPNPAAQMQKKDSSEAGLSIPRLLLVFALCGMGGLLAMFSFAATPPSGTLTDVSGPVTYTAGPFFQANQSPLGLGQLDSGPRCDAADPCDSFTLT